MGKQPTAKQIAARKKFGEAAKARAAANRAKKEEKPVVNTTTEPKPTPDVEVGKEASVEDLKRQIDELKAYLFTQGQQNTPQGPQVSQQGKMVGTFEKYLVDPDNYPDPSERLSKEPRLAQFAFEHNYELEFGVSVTQYETKDGINTKEPRFNLELRRIVFDDDGNPTNKRYIVRKMMFHEDPQAALVVARENGLPVDQSNEKLFLDEMRYLRAKDWLMDIFFPKPSVAPQKQSEEVIGGKLVQVVTINSENPSSIPFSQLSKKL